LLRNSIIGLFAAFGLWFLFNRISNYVETKKLNEDYTNTNTTENNTTENSIIENTGSLYKLTTDNVITAAHEEIIIYQKNTPLSEGKPDDNNGGVKFFKKLPTYQIDFRCDKAKGFDFWNRVKIDWDFDKKWDEKWDFRKNGSIKRQCSTNDDEVYDLIQETVEGKWQTVGETVKTTPENTTKENSLPTLHQEIISIQKNTALSEGKADDNNGGLKLYKKMDAYFLDLRCDKAKGFDYWNRAKVDWDKDKKWDEKWDFGKNGTIKRQISTKDDEIYDLTEQLVNGKWTK
jgi:hypothetical protein